MHAISVFAISRVSIVIVVFFSSLERGDDAARSHDCEEEKAEKQVVVRAVWGIKRLSQMLDKDIGRHALLPEFRLHQFDRLAADGYVLAR